MSTEPTKHQILVQQESAAIVKATPSSILELAVRQGANVETLSKLLELQERWEANEARKAFDVAFAAFKSEAPKLEKTREADFGPGKTKYRWAPLDEIAAKVDPILSKHGLSYSWEQSDQTKEAITVTCVLTHVLGHSKRCTLSGPPDNSGSKNPVQAISSATSYLRRYTLTGVLGMATSDEDTDGVTMRDAADFLALINESQTIEELGRHYKQAIADALNKQSPKAVSVYMQARQKREKELRSA